MKKLPVLLIGAFMALTSMFSMLNAQIITIGTGTIQNANTGYPAPYGNWYWGAKHQFLIPASEIYAAGGNPGLINGIGFNVVTPNGVALSGFEIKIKTTSSTALTTTFETGMTSVYYASTYTETAGWNMHTFSTPFIWDGASNIVIETCFNNGSYTYNAIVNQTTTAYVSSIQYHADASGICATASGATTHTQRPNIRLDMIPTNTPVNLGVLPWTNPTDYCNLPGAVPIPISIRNWGTDPQSNFGVAYSINGGASWVNETVTATIQPDDTLDYVFSTPANLSAAADYNCLLAVIAPGDTLNYNDTLDNLIISNRYSINTFPFTEDFESGGSDYLHVNDNSNAIAYIYNDGSSYVLRMEGGASGGWTGSATATTPSNAWNDNITHHSWATSCNLDATSVATLELWLDLKQYYSNIGPKYSWFRVLVNGTQISDIYGNSDFNPLTSDSDPWASYRFDLQPYVGTVFTLTLQASNYYDKIVSTPGDIAFVDNIILQEKPPFDAGIETLVSHLSGCGVSTNENITVRVKNYGSASITGFDVSYQADGGTVVTENIGAVTLNPSDTYDFTFASQADLTPAGLHTIKSWTSLTGDVDALNDTVEEMVTLAPFVTTYPFNEDFETFTVGTGTIYPNGWSISPTSGYRWQVEDGPTSSSNTGPTVDHTLGTALGRYFYTEASSGVSGSIAILISPCLDLSSMTNPQMKFWYHMYGSTIDTIWVDAFVGGVWIEDLYHLGGQHQTATGDPWLQAVVDLAPYSTLEKIRFRARRGTDFYGDISIDDINIFEPLADELEVVEWVTPESDCSLASAEQITIKIVNNGYNAQSNFDVTYSLDGTTFIAPETISAVLAPLDTLTYTFTATADFSVPGTYNCQAAVLLAGDMFTGNDTLDQIVNSFGVISSFPFLEDFESGTSYFFQPWDTTYSQGEIVHDGTSYVFEFEGGSAATGWTGSSTATTSAQAWTTNVTHHSRAISCGVDASSVSSLEMLIDMRQLYSNYGLKYSWFRVLVDGNPIADNDGHFEWNPATVSSDPWQTLRFDLQSYVGTSFNLTFQASMCYNSTYSAPGDKALLDNIVLREKLDNDVGVDALLTQVGGCGVSANEDVMIRIRNFGALPQTGFDVAYQVDGGTIVVENIGALNVPVGGTVDYLFSTQADLSVAGAHTVKTWTALATDSDLNNDTLNSNVNLALSVSTYPYLETFETFTTGTPGTFANGWTMTPPTGYQWQIDAGGTSSTNTGPTVDHTLGTTLGKYIYTEASSG
ncbi:MAG: hypothetical protein ABIJ16_07435, partial [Bacteroidota bacterium]